MADHTDATALLITAFLLHDGELTRAQVRDALADVDPGAATAACAELEALGMTCRREKRFGRWVRLYRCPMVLEIFAKPRLRLVKEAA